MTLAYVESLSRAKYQKPIKHNILIWKRANMEAMRLDMTKFAQEFNSKYTESTDVNSLCLAFTGKFSKLMDEHIPSKMTSQRFSQAWIDKEVRQMSRKKKRYYQKAKKSGKVRDWNKFQKIKKETQSTFRRTYNSYISNMLSDDNTSIPKRIWSFFKGKRTESTGVAPLRNGGILHSDTATKTNILNDQLTSVF
jgi:hypothetical protein